MITFTLFSIQFDLISLVLGAGIGVLLSTLLLYLFSNRRRKPEMFLSLREQLRDINTNLIDASKTIHNIDNTLEVVEKNAKN